MDDKAGEGGALRMPASAHEFWALALALLAVFLLVQIGAPAIRELEFLDPKLRDYFIGISFAAFPLIHRQCKRGLVGLAAQPPRQLDLTPWYVSGAFAAALLFAWNQFATVCGAFAIGMLHAQLPVGQVDNAAFMTALSTSLIAISIPMSAAASVFAGILLYRYTRSHVVAALLCASVLYLVFNLAAGFALQPDFVVGQVRNAIGQGVEGVFWFVVGIGIVAIVVLIFGGIGIAISAFNRERSLGRIVDGARRLPAAERELLAADISRRLDAAAAPQPPPAGAV